MEYEDIQDEARFKREVEWDVAVALGKRATDVKVTEVKGASLRPGSVIAQLEAKPLAGLSPAQVHLAWRVCDAGARVDMKCVPCRSAC